MIAQSLVEYGALSSVLNQFQATAYSVQEWFARTNLTTWLVIAVVAVLVLRVWNGRR